MARIVPIMNPFNPWAKTGFTLIEVVAAMTIVAIGLLGILKTFYMGNKMMALREERTAVTNLLQRVMEEAKAKPYNPDFTSSGPCTTLPGCTGICANLQGCTYEAKKQIYDLTLSLKRIDATISWSSPAWGPRLETVTAMITDR